MRRALIILSLSLPWVGHVACGHDDPVIPGQFHEEETETGETSGDSSSGMSCDAGPVIPEGITGRAECLPEIALHGIACKGATKVTAKWEHNGNQAVFVDPTTDGHFCIPIQAPANDEIKITVYQKVDGEDIPSKQIQTVLNVCEEGQRPGEAQPGSEEDSGADGPTKLTLREPRAEPQPADGRASELVDQDTKGDFVVFDQSMWSSVPYYHTYDGYIRFELPEPKSISHFRIFWATDQSDYEDAYGYHYVLMGTSDRGTKVPPNPDDPGVWVTLKEVTSDDGELHDIPIESDKLENAVSELALVLRESATATNSLWWPYSQFAMYEVEVFGGTAAQVRRSSRGACRAGR